MNGLDTGRAVHQALADAGYNSQQIRRAVSVSYNPRTQKTEITVIDPSVSHLLAPAALELALTNAEAKKSDVVEQERDAVELVAKLSQATGMSETQVSSALKGIR